MEENAIITKRGTFGRLIRTLYPLAIPDPLHPGHIPEPLHLRQGVSALIASGSFPVPLHREQLPLP